MAIRAIESRSAGGDHRGVVRGLAACCAELLRSACDEFQIAGRLDSRDSAATTSERAPRR
jgi:hypothetical protein